MKTLWHILRTFVPLRNSPWLGLVLACCSVSAADWQVVKYYNTFPDYNPAPAPAQSNSIASFTFPPASDARLFPAFLMVTQSTTMNLTGSTLRCIFKVTASSDATFKFGGQSNWNAGPTPPHCRFYFSTENEYRHNGNGTNYWFHGADRMDMTNALIGAFLQVTLTNASGWSDGQGGSSEAAFWSAASRAKAVGLAFGGGYFYDIGVAMYSGAAEFKLTAFECNPPFRVEIVGGFVGNNYGVEFSTNLVTWSTNGTPNPKGFARGKRL